MTRCTVIIPTFNRRDVLPHAVASVLEQDERDFELIVVDDASTDATREWLAQLTDPRLRVIRAEKNVGVSAARNLGLAEARSPIVAFLDSDDRYRPQRLNVGLAAMDREPNVVCTLASATKQVWDQIRTEVLPNVKLASPAFAWALYCDLFSVEGSAIMVRTDAARAIGGYCEGLNRTEDREFLIRLSAQGAVRLLPDVLWEKSWRSDSLSNAWTTAGRDLAAYFAQRPEYTGRFRKIGNYLATKILVADCRRGDFATLFADVVRFRAMGLLQGGLAKLWGDHREVRAYRRSMSNAKALASLGPAPAQWV